MASERGDDPSARKRLLAAQRSKRYRARMSPEKRAALREYNRTYGRAWRLVNQPLKERPRSLWVTDPAAAFARRRELLNKWRDENHQKYLATETAYRERNRERTNELQRARRAADPEKYREKQRARYAADPVKLRSYRTRRIYREKRGLEMAGSHTKWEWEVRLLEFGGCCAHCGTNERIERDHIAPITRGGTDLIENIQPLCRSCNARKSATVPIAA